MHAEQLGDDLVRHISLLAEVEEAHSRNLAQCWKNRSDQPRADTGKCYIGRISPNNAHSVRTYDQCTGSVHGRCGVVTMEPLDKRNVNIFASDGAANSVDSYSSGLLS